MTPNLDKDACACPLCGCQEGNATNGTWACAECSSRFPHQIALVRNQSPVHKKLAKCLLQVEDSDEGMPKQPLLAKDVHFYLLAEVVAGLVNNRLRGDLRGDLLRPDLERCLKECLEDPEIVHERVGWDGDRWSSWREKKL